MSYNGNGNTGGTPPASVTQSANTATSVTGRASLVKIDHTFSGWNTSADGSGRGYLPGDTFIFTANTTLYAQWVVPISPLPSIVWSQDLESGYLFGFHWNGSWSARQAGPSSYVRSGNYSMGATPAAGPSDQRLTLNSGLVNIPTDATAATLIFWHTFLFDSYGGVLETSIDDGSTWQDAGARFIRGGYTGTLDGSPQNPLAGRRAWVGYAVGGYGTFQQVVMDLTPFRGQNLRFRLRMGGAADALALPWYVDDVVVSHNGTPSPTPTSTPITPRVLSLTPADGETNVPTSSPIVIKFDREMNPSTIFTNGMGSNSCFGTVQVSSDGFATCATLQDPVGSINNSVFTAAASLMPTSNYKIRLLTFQDYYGVQTAGGSTQPNGFNTVALYNVFYNGNGNTGGIAPDDFNSYPAGSAVTVLGNTGNLVKTGYTFAGWNTSADGSGITYRPGQTFSISNYTLLYAKWAPIQVTVSGRVFGIGDRGSTNAVVRMAGTNNTFSATVITRRNGSFQFQNVPSNGSFTITVTQRRFTYFPVNVQTVGSNISGLSIRPN